MNRFLSFSRDFGRSFLLLSLLLLASNWSFAQLSTATLNGNVRDSKGASVPGATITLHNVETSVNNTTVSNGSGAYVFVSISPGNYTLQTKAPGFSSAEIPVFTLTVGQVAKIDFSLKVGSQSFKVVVQGATPQLNVSNANLGTVIGARQVNNLPLNGRNFTELLALTPGVSTVSVAQNSGGGHGPVARGSSFTAPAIQGQSNRSNFYLLDGLADTEYADNTYALPPVIDAMQEFKVVSHTDTAAFGSVLGGVINVVTKSGTNELHGSAWEYARNTIFDARGYFLPKTVAKTPYSQNQFGGAMGGPVVIPKLYNGKNKTFFFGAYQGFRYSETSTGLLKVPTAAELAGDESSWPTQLYNPFSTRPDPAKPGAYIRDPFPGNQIQSVLDPRMVDLAKFMYPAAGPVLNSAGDNAIDTTPITQTQNEWNVRIDQKIGENDSAWFRYSTISNAGQSSGGLPGLLKTSSNPALNWGGSYVHVFSPSLVLQGQFGRTHVANNNLTLYRASTTNIFNQVGFLPSFAGDYNAAGVGNLLPNVTITGFSGGGENGGSNPDATSSYETSGNLTKVAGNHNLQFGGGLIWHFYHTINATSSVGFDAQQTGDTNPSDSVNTGDALASFLINVPDTATRRNEDERERFGGVVSGYAQDSWKVTDRLTLNYGLRYDLSIIPPYGTYSSIGQNGGIETGDMDFNNGTYIVQVLPPACSVRGHAPCIPGDGSLPAHVVVSPNGKIAHNQYTNFGPRVGFAVRAARTMSVRGGFGMVYDNWAAVSQMAQNIAGLWPDIGNPSIANLNVPSTTSATPTLTAQDPFASAGNSLFPAATPFNQVGYFYDPQHKIPVSYQWNLGVEKLLNESATMTLNYVGSVSRRLNEGGYYNTAITPGLGNPQSRAPYPYIHPTNYDRSFGNTGSYNALQFSLNRRYMNGLSYGVSYTWSKTIDIGGDGFFGVEGGVPQDPYHPSRYDRSVAGYDLSHYLAVNTLYQIPLGRGKSFSTKSGALNYILGNWQVNNIFSAHSGIPFGVYISGDIANTGNAHNYEHASLVGDPHLSKRTSAEWFNTAAYAAPARYTFGTAGRNSLRTAPYWNLDTSLFRTFPIGGGRQFEFRAEAFNLLNNVVLGRPTNNINSGASFGTITGTNNGSRELQLALKFLY